MKNYLPLSLFLWLAACSSPAAQNTSQQPIEKKDSTAGTAVAIADTVQPEEEEEVENNITEPPYGLEKVKALIGKLQLVDEPEGGDAGTKALDKKTYAALSLNEKFTYHMINPESYSQNCDILPLQPKKAERIYGTLRQVFGEYSWSDRQEDFFKNNRDTVTKLMKTVIEKNRSVGNNFKEAIIDMNATEMIPFLINFYNQDKKDHFILTTLLLLMQKNQYPEFINSTGYKKLYGGDRANEDVYNAPHLVYNKANEDLIIQRATKFYNGLQAK
jgi:hypothetical protein